jgi:hypothetical protein
MATPLYIVRQATIAQAQCCGLHNTAALEIITQSEKRSIKYAVRLTPLRKLANARLNRIAFVHTPTSHSSLGRQYTRGG